MKRCIHCGRYIPAKAVDCHFCDATQESGPLGWWWVVIIVFPVLSLTVGYLNAGLRDSEAFYAQMVRWSLTLIAAQVMLFILLNIF